MIVAEFSKTPLFCREKMSQIQEKHTIVNVIGQTPSGNWMLFSTFKGLNKSAIALYVNLAL